MLTQTTIELLDMHLEQCPRCGMLPFIGYKRWDKYPFIIGCPRCNNIVTSSDNIEGLTHFWNSWAIVEAKKIQEAEDAD